MSEGRSARAVLRERPMLADALLALGLWLCEAVLWLLGPAEFHPRSWAFALSYSLVGMVSVALRRRYTWLAVTLLAVHTAVPFLGPDDVRQTEAVAIVVVTYTAAAYLPLRAAALATALLWLPLLVLAVSAGDTTRPPVRLEPGYFLLFNTMAATVCFMVGRTVHHRRAYVAALEDRARAAEQDQQTLTAQAVAEERRRIARELHDVVAHHVSVMGVLATGSRRTLRRDPEATDEALATIEETGRTALREMRRLLDVLRTDAEPPGELAPQPGLAGVSVLVEQVREAGLPVRLAIEGSPDPLDPGVALTIYRIVQEALTNAIKHAGAATAEVRLQFGRYWMTVEISDTGRGPQLGGGGIGHGLLGMRERVTLYGGTLRAGPRPGGGFRVYARIPVEALDGDGRATGE